MLDVISLSGSVIAKMVAARPPELRNRALRPAQPHWYGTITAGHRQRHRGDRAALSDTVSLTGRARPGPVTGDYRAACAVLETPVNALEPEFVTRTGRPGCGHAAA